jgi:UDP-N-acetylglucosamine 3-dehydrogenase
MGDRPGIGVIGVGAFGSQHAAIYKQMERCELRAVADVNPDRLGTVCPALQVEGYDDYRELLRRDDVQAVSVCTTDELHVEAAVAAARAGKHVFVEKPLALTPGDCDRIIEAARSARVKLMVGHILRFDPRYVAASEEIQQGKIGQLVHLYARRSNPIHSAERLAAHTSVLFFLGIHDLDLINWCVGLPAERVYAEATSVVLEGAPDAVLALIRFPGGTVASLEVSWILPPAFPGRLDARFEAVGTQGAVYVNGGSENVGIVQEQYTLPELHYAPQVRGERVGILRDELTHFVRCVAQDRDPVVGGKEGRAAVELACAIQASFESGSTVELAR